MNYLNHISNMPIVIVDTHELDFVQHPEHYEYLKSLLDRDFKNGITTVIPQEDPVFS